MPPRAPSLILKEEVIPYLTFSLQDLLCRLPTELKDNLLEIRLRVGRPVMLVFSDMDMVLPGSSSLSRPEMEQCMQLITQSSVYAREEELRQGFITLPGGHRVGLVGKAVLEDGRIRTLKNISSLNIRLARQVVGAADKVVSYLVQDGSFISTLLVSPPGCGKTTLLRDLIRQLSSGIPKLNLKGHKIAVVDERSEIAACYQGMPQNDVGPRTDVLDGAKKAEGIMLVLRSMSPEIIATDEIGSSADVVALEEALVSGVRLVATAHGDGPDDLQERPVLRELLKHGLFGRIVFLSMAKGPGTIEAVFNGQDLKPMFIEHLSIGGGRHDIKTSRCLNTDICYG
ncbi:MAG: stage III sporulation protein AA [Firmicutes bacterium]|nr:stage III sporulation protein AA [Bacillota bacterium]